MFLISFKYVNNKDLAKDTFNKVIKLVLLYINILILFIIKKKYKEKKLSNKLYILLSLLNKPPLTPLYN